MLHNRVFSVAEILALRQNRFERRDRTTVSEDFSAFSRPDR